MIVEMLNGGLHEGEPPHGKSLRCPVCREPNLKVTLGAGLGKLLVHCRCSKTRERHISLVRAVTKVTGVSLDPPPRRVSPREAVERMRRSPAYEGLSPKAKALVDHLVRAYFDGGPNGGISETGTELMAGIGTHSRKQLYKAINAAIDTKIVFKGSRAWSNGQASGSSNLWGLVCLQREHPKRSRRNSTEQDRGGTKWGDKVDLGGQRGVQPIDLTKGDCTVVYDPSSPTNEVRTGGEAEGPRSDVSRSSPETSVQRKSRTAESDSSHPLCGHRYGCGSAGECLHRDTCLTPGWGAAS
jgi:hypothetical protein